MTDPTNRPLWRRMHKAQMDADPFNNTKGYAAELRAIAKWIEECTVSTTAFGPNDMPVVWRIAGMLLTEADRAEAAAVYEQARERNHMRKNRGTTADS
jgi:hypothetical protein